MLFSKIIGGISKFRSRGITNSIGVENEVSISCSLRIDNEIDRE